MLALTWGLAHIFTEIVWGEVIVITDVFGAIIISAIAYYILKHAVKNGIIEAYRYINEHHKNEQNDN